MGNELVILIPAFNEGPRIGSVLDVVCEFPYKKQIVVIDDGSKDDTATKAARYPVKILSHKQNRGKGAALQTGIDYIGKAPYWLFLDADLINLRHQHLEVLLQPLKENPRLGMTVGMFKGGRKNVDLAQRYFGILNGQRGLSGDFVASLPDLSWCRFGVEIFLSKLAEHKGIPVSFPVLEGLTHFTKEAKFGLLPGFIYRLQMFRECLYALRHWQKYC